MLYAKNEGEMSLLKFDYHSYIYQVITYFLLHVKQVNAEHNTPEKA